MDDFLQKVQILSRVEMAIFKINMQTMSKQIVLYAVGLVLILLAVAMLNVAIYMVLSAYLGRGPGALIVAAINAFLAAIIIVIAGRTKPGPEADMAKEIRDFAMTEINKDVKDMRQSVDEFKSDVQRIRTGFNSLIGGGGGDSSLGIMSLAPSLGPLLDLLIGWLKKSKK